LEIKGDPSFHAKGKGLQTWCVESHCQPSILCRSQ
jgi:hypothetical protein